MKAVERVMKCYGGLEFEKQGVCPECLAKKRISEASVWNWTFVRTAVKKGDVWIRCKSGHGRVDSRLVSGLRLKTKPRNEEIFLPSDHQQHIVPVASLLSAVVMVGLWDIKNKKIVEVGSGFIVDKKRGLIVTAAHTVINIFAQDDSGSFGAEYKGLKSAKIVIGVIPTLFDSDDTKSKSERINNDTTAVFRYFAKIVVKDKLISSEGRCEVDACVLAITTKLEHDVSGQAKECGEQSELLLLHDSDAMKSENLQQLKLTEISHLEESVRILGYNQGGEGLERPGSYLNRCADFAQ